MPADSPLVVAHAAPAVLLTGALLVSTLRTRRRDTRDER
jgi:hypothetical protein